MRTVGGRKLVATRMAALAVALTAAVVVPTQAAASPSSLSCRGDGQTPQPIGDVSSFTAGTVVPAGMHGYYVAPTNEPKGLVVFSHGHTASPIQWFPQMARAAKNDGVIAVTLYYPGEKIVNAAGDTTFGWRVREGAQAGIDVAKAFISACPKLKHETIVDYGVSMGGNTSGLIAAAGATRPDGAPLFNYWFDIEGVTNVIETYAEATAIAQAGGAIGNAGLAATGNQAVTEINQENGGTPTQQPAAYQNLAVVTHGHDIAASGIKGVVLVHGVDDGEVPYDQSGEMLGVLISAGLPTDFYSVATKTPGSDGSTTLDGDVLGSSWDSPFAGHGGEGSKTQLVIQTGLRALDALFQRGFAPSGHREFLVDGTLGTTFPPPG